MLFLVHSEWTELKSLNEMKWASITPLYSTYTVIMERPLEGQEGSSTMSEVK